MLTKKKLIIELKYCIVLLLFLKSILSYFKYVHIILLSSEYNYNIPTNYIAL